MLVLLRKEKSHTVFLKSHQEKSILTSTYLATQFNTRWCLALCVSDIAAGTEATRIPKTQFLLPRWEEDRQFQL